MCHDKTKQLSCRQNLPVQQTLLTDVCTAEKTLIAKKLQKNTLIAKKCFQLLFVFLFSLQCCASDSEVVWSADSYEGWSQNNARLCCLLTETFAKRKLTLHYFFTAAPALGVIGRFWRTESLFEFPRQKIYLYRYRSRHDWNRCSIYEVSRVFTETG